MNRKDDNLYMRDIKHLDEGEEEYSFVKEVFHPILLTILFFRALDLDLNYLKLDKLNS